MLRRWSREWEERPAAIVAVPSRSWPRRVRGMAEHLAEVGRLPLIDALRVERSAAAQDGVASATRVRQLLETLSVDPEEPLPAGPVLLVDDVRAPAGR